MNYASTSNIREVTKFNNPGDKTFETDFNYVFNNAFPPMENLENGKNENVLEKSSKFKRNAYEIRIEYFLEEINDHKSYGSLPKAFLPQIAVPETPNFELQKSREKGHGKMHMKKCENPVPSCSNITFAII